MLVMLVESHGNVVTQLPPDEDLRYARFQTLLPKLVKIQMFLLAYRRANKAAISKAEILEAISGRI